MNEIPKLTSEDYLSKLNALITKAELTNSDLAQIIGVSPSTVSRLRNGEVTMTLEYATGMVMAAGGSLDELVGIKAATQEDVILISRELIASWHSRLADKDKTIGEKDDTISYHRKWLKTFFVSLAVVILFILFVLAIDLLNGTIGYIRY